MRAILYSLLLCIAGVLADAPSTGPESTIWTVVAIDPKGDSRGGAGVDAAQLSYQYDRSNDLLWLRVATFGPPQPGKLVMRIAVDGTDRVLGEPVRVDGNAAIAGIKRSRLGDAMAMKIVASIGTATGVEDQIPNGDPIAIDLLAARMPPFREIDTSRNNLIMEAKPGRPDRAAPPLAVQRGNGPTPLILVPGVYSGDSVYDSFMARNGGRYTFHMIIPRGLNGTTAPPMPPQSVSYGDGTWTRALERDILAVIESRNLARPILVVHGFPGSLAAEGLAVRHPEKLGGIVELASMAVQPYPSADRSREVTPLERIALVDDGWARQWFKYVTPETWDSNNYPSAMFANDPSRAGRARQQVEQVPLPVKIRYLLEFMAADHRPLFPALSVPIMMVRPGFNHEILSNPAFAWFKVSFEDGWSRYPANPMIDLTTIPDARALLLDDQPERVDRAIEAFVASRLQAFRGGDCRGAPGWQQCRGDAHSGEKE
jgi:pimeloyl-ACP methyl ester carboxylesterase